MMSSSFEEYLECPACSGPGVPADDYDLIYGRFVPAWRDQQRRCVSCNVLLRVQSTACGETSYVERVQTVRNAAVSSS